MLIAHLSDTHIAGMSRKAYGVVPTTLNLERCVDSVNQLSPPPDVAIVTGDITYSGLEEESRCAADLLEKLRCPYYIVPGNHDKRAALLSVFGHRACPKADNGFLNYVIEDFGVRLLAVDSTRTNKPGGELCKIRLDWLEKQLSVKKTVPTVIFMHHPPAKFRVLESDEDGFIGAGKLGKLLRQHDNIHRILCGHIHMSAHLDWCGTIISTAPSMGMGIVLDLTLKRPSEFVREAPAYQLHYFTPDKTIVSHLVTVKDVDGPYEFTDYTQAKDKN